MAGVPREHTEWMRRRYAGRKSRIIFDDFISDLFDVLSGLDQGDPHSGIVYLIYNSGLAKIPVPKNGEKGFIYVDDNTMGASGRDFHIAHAKILDMTVREDGVDEWEETHNAKFGPEKYQLLDASRQ
ncbi:hypothetical protein C8R47DRAFT_913218, partial [Mycena vitilis]